MNLIDLTELRDQIRDDLAAVEKVLAIAKSRAKPNGGALSLPLARSIIEKSHNPKRKYGAVTWLVSIAISLCPDEFTFADVERNLERPLKQEQISLALNRLIKQGKIAVMKPRHGRTPAIYKKRPTISGGEAAMPPKKLSIASH